MIRKCIFLFLFAIVLSGMTKANENYPYRFINSVYDEYIRTVTCEINNLPSNFPVLRLNGSERLVVKFDDLLNEERNYYYRIIHCNFDWTPSNLKEFDYINGFNDERLRNFEYSVGTKTPFIHYWQEFPNRDTKFKVSGNYLLIIYEESIDYPIITRRFVVSESQTSIKPLNTLVANTAHYRSHQDFQFEVDLNNIIYRDPQNELTLVVVQNENWDAIQARHPNFLSRNVARFTSSGMFSFPGLSEYREFDTRGLLFIRRGIKRIERNNRKTDVLLNHAYSRGRDPYLLKFDFNGKFFINNLDALNLGQQAVASEIVNASQQIIQAERDSIVNYARSGAQAYTLDQKNINADYVNIIYTLEMPDDLQVGEDVFVLGSMNDWEPREEYRMRPSENGSYLTAEVMTKQGYYNFYYGILKNDGSIDYQTLEGSWNETENDYQVIAYFRGFGDIYDRVIGFNSFNTTTIVQSGF